MRALTIIVAVLALGFAACGAHSQQEAIKDARLGIAIAGEATKAANLAATEHFKTFPASDTEHYCKGEVCSLVFEEVQSLLLAGADAVKLWETSLAVYLAKKDAGTDTKADWDTILSSEAAWIQIAGDAIAALDFVMRELEHAGVKLPAVVAYAWRFLYGLTGRDERPPFDMDWSKIASGVCAQYMPGAP